MPIVLVSCAPVTNPTEAVCGMPSSSLAQRPATCSAAIAAGDMTRVKAFWSQPVAIRSAAIAESTEPPVTKPK